MLGHMARAGKRRWRRECMSLIALALAVGALLPMSSHAAALWSVDKLIQENLTAVTGKPVRLPDGTVLSSVRVEYLRALFEAHASEVLE